MRRTLLGLRGAATSHSSNSAANLACCTQLPESRPPWSSPVEGMEPRLDPPMVDSMPMPLASTVSALRAYRLSTSALRQPELADHQLDHQTGDSLAQAGALCGNPAFCGICRDMLE